VYEAYKIAEAKIGEGLGPVARWLLASVSAVFGVVSVIAAESSDAPAILDSFGAFCILIAVACVTSGRIRQFFGSAIGLALFVVGLAYIYLELHGPFVSSRSEPSLLNSLLFSICFGLPGIRYAMKARFGFCRGISDQ